MSEETVQESVAAEAVEWVDSQDAEGGWYEVPGGQKVQGREEALAAYIDFLESEAPDAGPENNEVPAAPEGPDPSPESPDPEVPASPGPPTIEDPELEGVVFVCETHGGEMVAGDPHRARRRWDCGGGPGCVPEAGMTLLEKTRRVLDYMGPTAGGFMEPSRIRYSRRPDEPGDIPTEVLIDSDTWDELGKPVAITVTIEPGDLLNGDEEE